jgi:hypothetical protein
MASADKAAQLGAFDGTLTDFVTEAMKLPEAQGWRGCGCCGKCPFFHPISLGKRWKKYGMVKYGTNCGFSILYHSIFVPYFTIL